MPPQITALPGKNGETRTLHFSPKWCISASTSRCLISSIFLIQDSYSRSCMTP